METYELCKTIRMVILNSAAEVIAYESWGGDFCAEEIRGTTDRSKKIPGFSAVDLSRLTSLQMDDLGFGFWSEDRPIRLIPLWLMPFLQEEVDCESISGEARVFKKSDIDNDNRYGCLAYGVIPKQ